MNTNILVTGAAGYVGGSVVADLVRWKEGILSKATIHAAVRSEEQVQSLSGTAVQVFKADGQSMSSYVVSNEIDVIVNTANSIDERIILNLVRALAARREASGKSTYLIHALQILMLTPAGNTVKSKIPTLSVFNMEKELGEGYAQRTTDVFTIEQSQAHRVDAIIVMPVNIYGKGSGTWNQISLHIPGYIRSAVKHRKVYKFAESGVSPLVHIDELSDFYVLLVEAILRRDGIATGEDGYIFVQSHRTAWWDILEGLGKAMYARGLVDEPTTTVWPSDQVLTESLEVPAVYAHSIWNSEAFIVGERAKALDWEPTWSTEKLLNNLDAEIDAAMDIEANKTSLIRSIKNK